MTLKFNFKPISWLKKPTLLNAEEFKHATWLELFFDLVYVSVVAQLSHYLESHTSVSYYFFFCLMFIPVLWSWVGHTLFANRFDSEDGLFTMLTLIQMVGAAIMAVGVEETLDGNTNIFAIGYILCRLVLLLMYYRVHKHIPEARKTTKLFMSGFGVGVLIWIISLFIPAPYTYFVWGLGIIIELVTPWIKADDLDLTPVNRYHLPERFGLFTIIILGESVLTIVDGVAENGLRLNVAVSSLFGFVLIAAIWWLYFEYIEKNTIAKRRFKSTGIFVYSHLPIYISLATLAVGIRQIMLDSANTDSGVWLTGLGLIIFVISFNFIKNTCYPTRDKITRILVTAGFGTILIAVALFTFTYWSPFISLVLISLMYLGFVAFERLALD